ncbi:ATPase [Alcanivorax xiamenensis]|uniref:ATPase n=1 Tax=Alcanivorax xiamenensis TaxID=1177156 RepID=A0ABQ6YB44_9GAMM|nr:ATPase [Alcanivorax xiamenensis]
MDVKLVLMLDQPVTVEQIRSLHPLFQPALANVRGPYNQEGAANPGYLFEYTWEALAILLSDRKIRLPKVIRRWLPEIKAVPMESSTAETAASRSLPQRSTQQFAREWLPKVQASMAEQGFHYSLAEVTNFYLSLRTKQLVLLAGISGTGKTQLVRQFAKAIGYGDADHCELIAVRPDWADSSDLIGYENIQGQFVSQPFLNVLKRAMAHPDDVYFVILDEMNLARVEHYFAEFLSFIETRYRDDDDMVVTAPWINRADVNGGQPVLIPQNVMVVGTVNMDETTHPFSRKVLDRANAIEMNDIDLSWAAATGPAQSLSGIYADALAAPFLNAKDLSDEQKAALREPLKLLVSINEILEPAGLQFGYRVRDEVAFYLTLHRGEQLDTLQGFSSDAAMDFQLMQKVLPRIQGSSMAVLKALIKLLSLLSKTPLSEEAEFSEIAKAVSLEKTNFPRSVKKLLFMLKRYSDDGFTSFWL